MHQPYLPEDQPTNAQIRRWSNQWRNAPAELSNPHACSLQSTFEPAEALRQEIGKVVTAIVLRWRLIASASSRILFAESDAGAARNADLIDGACPRRRRPRQ